MPLALLALLQTTAATPDLPGITLHPLYRAPFACIEHPAGQATFLGDALGTDCMVTGGGEPGGPGFTSFYRTDGRANADWYGWGAEVLAPFDGVVERVVANPVVNTPGTVGRPPAAMILFRRADGTNVLYAHVADVTVAAGDSVRAGQPVARIGNNGISRLPHIHVGAYRGAAALQVRWDLRAMGRVRALGGGR